MIRESLRSLSLTLTATPSASVRAATMLGGRTTSRMCQRPCTKRSAKKVYPWTPGTKSLLPLSKAKRSHLMRAKTRASTCRCKHTVGAVKPLCGLFWRRTASNPLREFKPNLRRFRADVQTGDDAHSEDFRQGRKSSRRKRGGLRLHPPLGHSGRQCRPHKGFCAFEALFYRLGCGTAMSENCRLQPPKTPCLQPLYRRLRA